MGELAVGYRDGWDAAPDLDLATKWFERAADFTVEAMYQSYLMYSQDTVANSKAKLPVLHFLGFGFTWLDDSNTRA